MSEERPVVPAGEITENDKILAALSYPIPIVGVVILVVDEMRKRPFQKYHALQAIAVNILLWAVIGILRAVLGLLPWILDDVLGPLPLLLWLVTLYWGYLAYKGQYLEIPWLTGFLKEMKLL